MRTRKAIVIAVLTGVVSITSAGCTSKLGSAGDEPTSLMVRAPASADGLTTGGLTAVGVFRVAFANANGCVVLRNQNGGVHDVLAVWPSDYALHGSAIVDGQHSIRAIDGQRARVEGGFVDVPADGSKCGASSAWQVRTTFLCNEGSATVAAESDDACLAGRAQAP